ncbi:hypothetical protein L9F63_005501, partial [Diploptera punctata]
FGYSFFPNINSVRWLSSSLHLQWKRVHQCCEPYFHTPCFRGNGRLRNAALHTSYFGLMLVQPRKFHGDFQTVYCSRTPVSQNAKVEPELLYKRKLPWFPAVAIYYHCIYCCARVFLLFCF